MQLRGNLAVSPWDAIVLPERVFIHSARGRNNSGARAISARMRVPKCVAENKNRRAGNLRNADASPFLSEAFAKRPRVRPRVSSFANVSALPLFSFGQSLRQPRSAYGRAYATCGAFGRARS